MYNYYFNDANGDEQFSIWQFLQVGAEELSSCKEQAVMQFRAHKLDKKDFFGKSDPFLTFSRSNEDGR